MSKGTYQEDLPCKGTLNITDKYWEISYYFSGPDLRHNGTFVTIPGNSIENYISAFIDNMQEYKSLKATIPKGGEFSKDGKMGMSIRVGNFADGVCLKHYHMPISNEKHLEIVINSYRYAKQRSQQIQEFLRSL